RDPRTVWRGERHQRRPDRSSPGRTHARRADPPSRHRATRHVLGLRCALRGGMGSRADACVRLARSRRDGVAVPLRVPCRDRGARPGACSTPGMNAANAPVWDDGSTLDLPPLHGEERTDVCVVGLGGSGLAAVTELLRHGADVIGVDAGAVAGGAAGRNGGFLLAGIAAAHHDAVAAMVRERTERLYAAAADELDRFAEEQPEAMRRPGSLRIEEDEDELRDCEAQLAQLRADGFTVERYQGPEGTDQLFPYDGVFSPTQRCRRQ